MLSEPLAHLRFLEAVPDEKALTVAEFLQKSVGHFVTGKKAKAKAKRALAGHKQSVDSLRGCSKCSTHFVDSLGG